MYNKSTIYPRRRVTTEIPSEETLGMNLSWIKWLQVIKGYLGRCLTSLLGKIINILKGCSQFYAMTLTYEGSHPTFSLLRHFILT